MEPATDASTLDRDADEGCEEVVECSNAVLLSLPKLDPLPGVTASGSCTRGAAVNGECCLLCALLARGDSTELKFTLSSNRRTGERPALAREGRAGGAFALAGVRRKGAAGSVVPFDAEEAVNEGNDVAHAGVGFAADVPGNTVVVDVGGIGNGENNARGAVVVVAEGPGNEGNDVAHAVAEFAADAAGGQRGRLAGSSSGWWRAVVTSADSDAKNRAASFAG